MSKETTSTYADGGYPESENLEILDMTAGFKVGQEIWFATDFADDVPKGGAGIITAVDNHPVHPITVDYHKPDGNGCLFGIPVAAHEILADNPNVPVPA